MTGEQVKTFVDGVEKAQGDCGFMVCAISGEDIRDNCTPEQYGKFLELPEDSRRELLEDIASSLYGLLEETDFMDAIREQVRREIK